VACGLVAMTQLWVSASTRQTIGFDCSARCARSVQWLAPLAAPAMSNPDFPFKPSARENVAET
jgi:hypothetical protein